MEKIFKNKAGYDVISFFMHKSGKGEPFHFKPLVCPHWDSLHSVKYNSGDTYDTISYYVPLTVQFFWLGLIFAITIHKRKLGDGKMVRYQDTHHAVIDELNPSTHS